MKVLMPVLAVNMTARGMAWAYHALSWSRSAKPVLKYNTTLALFPQYLYDWTGSAVLFNPGASGNPLKGSVVL